MVSKKAADSVQSLKEIVSLSERAGALLVLASRKAEEAGLDWHKGRTLEAREILEEVVGSEPDSIDGILSGDTSGMPDYRLC